MSDFYLPKNDDYVLVLGLIGALEIEAARHFYEYVNQSLSEIGESEWFEDVRHYRLSIGDNFPYRTAVDLRFLLGEAGASDSQISHALPSINIGWLNNACNLRTKLNQFHHQNLAPSLVTLNQVAQLVEVVTAPLNLEVTTWARAIQARVKALLSGAYSMVSPTEQEKEKIEVPQLTNEYELVLQQQREYPAWGSKWNRPKPSRKLTLSRNTREIYDSNGVSVKPMLGELAEVVVDAWLRYFPLGGEVWVDSDGATMSYIRGRATMIGWFGPEPDTYRDQVWGFSLPYRYVIDNGEIKESSSGLSLRESSGQFNEHLEATVSKSIPAGLEFEVSDYGDVFIPVDDGKPKRIVRVNKLEWFPGHLPG